MTANAPIPMALSAAVGPGRAASATLGTPDGRKGGASEDRHRVSVAAKYSKLGS